MLNNYKIILYNLTHNIMSWFKLIEEKINHRIFPDKLYLSLLYKTKFGKKLDWQKPKTFNEKLQWLKIYDRRPEYTTYVDKYKVREYIAKTIGEEYLIPLLGVWDSPDEIDFEKLPNQFVLKCNHDSGNVFICRDKTNFDIKAAKEKLRRSLKKDYYIEGREWPYKNVPRKIIAEKYMVDESGYELKDYKIFNFNGEPKLIQVDFDRFKNHLRNLYKTDWEKINVAYNYASSFEKIIEKPCALNEMLNLAKKISENKPFCRTDFYHINGKVYFGEITLFPEAGFGKFNPTKFGDEIGSWIELPLSGGDTAL